MKIVIVVDTFPSVSETFISNKVKQLSASGHKLIVLCAKKNDELLGELFKENCNLKVLVLNRLKLLMYLLGSPLTVFEAIIKFSNIRQQLFRKFRFDTLQKLRPDIVHFEFSGIGVDYLFEIKHLTCKKVVSCRGSAEKVKLLVHDERKEKFQEMLDEVDAIHCVSGDMRNTILPYCSRPEKIVINYPSIDTVFFKRSNSFTNNGTVTILSVGRFTFQKGFITGLKAVHVLKQSGIPFKWIIVGNGPDYEEIIFTIHHLQLEDYVVLAGSKSGNEVKELMEQAHIYFLPSVYEGIANVVLEAMSMELPVVATKSGGMEEVIKHGTNGLLTGIYDYESMAENLLHLIKNSSLRGELGKNARSTIEEKFNLKIQTQLYIDIYSKLADRPSKNIIDVAGYDAPKVNNKINFTAQYNGQDKKLNIGVIVPEFPSISETFFINKIAGLCQRGHNVTVFCSSEPIDGNIANDYKLQQYASLRIVKLDFKKSVFSLLKAVLLHPAVLTQSLDFNPSTFWRRWHINLCQLYMHKYACDIYHFGYSGIALHYMSLLPSLKGKKIISCRGTAENIKLVTEKERVKKLSVLFNEVHSIHCVSEDMATTMKSYGAPQEKIYINRPAIDLEFFKRKEDLCDRRVVRIISIGRLVFQKGFLLGILAIKELKNKYPDFIWTIVGDGPAKEELISHIHLLGLNDHIRLVGRKNRKEIKELCEDTDIYFLPSVSEGLANAVLEAMAMKIAVVSSDAGGMREAITHNVNGLLCKKYDILSMAENLDSLCRDYSKRKRMGEEGRKTVEAKFSLTRYIDVFEKQYLNLL